MNEIFYSTQLLPIYVILLSIMKAKQP